MKAVGDFARLKQEGRKISMVTLPDLVLVGLERALALNPGASRPWMTPISDITL